MPITPAEQKELDDILKGLNKDDPLEPPPEIPEAPVRDPSEYYFPTQNVPPTGVSKKEAYYGPLEESADIKLDLMKKARAVTEAKDPKEVAQELESVRKDFIKAYNRNAARVLTQGGPPALMHQRAAGPKMKELNYSLPEDITLDEAFKLTGKSSQGPKLQHYRDEYDKLRLGVEDVRDSMLSWDERMALGLYNRGDAKEYIENLPGVDKVGYDEELGTFLVTRNGKVGLADEKGASISDVLEMSGPIADALLTLGLVEAGPAQPVVKKATKEGIKGAYKQIRNFLHKATEPEGKKAITTGVTEGAVQLAREKGMQHLLPEEAEKVPLKQLGKEALVTGVFSGAGQKATDWAASRKQFADWRMTPLTILQ